MTIHLTLAEGIHAHINYPNSNQCSCRVYMSGWTGGCIPNKESIQPTVNLPRPMSVLGMMTKLNCIPKLNHLMPFPFLVHNLCQRNTKVYPPTCSECPTHSLTPQGIICRHNKVISGVPLDLLREGDGGHSTLGGGGITIDQVGVRWISTIVNGAGVPWLKHALHVCTCWVG